MFIFPAFFPSEGLFVPTDQSGAGVPLTNFRSTYTKLGTRYLVETTFAYAITADASNTLIGLGVLPAFANVTGVAGVFAIYNGAAVLWGFATPGANTFGIFSVTGVRQTNANLSNLTLRTQFQLATV